MKWYVLLLCLGLVCVVALAQSIDLTDIDEEGDDDDAEDGTVVTVVDTNQETRPNPCNSKNCRRGETCILTDDFKPKCVCRQDCHGDNDPRHMVCSVKNITFDSECHLDREFCWCKNKLPQCGESNIKKLRIDYYGECKEMTKCQDVEMEQFPERMKNWTFVVMREMARRHQLDDGYLQLLKSAQADDHHTDAVIWKFCDLDVKPHDRKVTRREMLFIVASVKPLEHCLVPFLNKCDKNGDRNISLFEWGECLGLDPKSGEIQDKCLNIHNRNA